MYFLNLPAYFLNFPVCDSWYSKKWRLESKRSKDDSPVLSFYRKYSILNRKKENRLMKNTLTVDNIFF
ncbi:MAG: hypothetical protein D3904_08165 [Candidatus Electrothrix sp. EH2]|nr:hypothetical protein [Candidatus Electrothrix sp. EH2]